MRAEHFDVVVLGDQLAGGVAAAVLAARDHRVLWLCPGEDGDGPAGAPRSRPVPDLTETPVLAALRTALGRPELVPEGAGRPLGVVIERDRRLLLQGDDERLIDELERELSEPSLEQSVALIDLARRCRAVVDDWLAQAPLPVSGWFWRRATRWALRPLVRAPEAAEAREALDRVSPEVRSLLVEPARLLQPWTPRGDELMLLRAVAQLVDGVVVDFDGLAGLGRELRTQVESHGGRVERGVRVDQLELSGKRIQAVITRHPVARYGCRSLVLAMDLGLVTSWIGKLRLVRKLDRLEAALRQGPYEVETRVELPRGTLPEGLAPGNFLLAADQVWFVARGADRDGRAELVLVGRQPVADHDDAQAAALTCLRDVVPFVDQASPQLRCNLDSEQPTGSVSLRPFAADGLLGVPALSPLLPIDHACLANRQLLPGLGAEGQITCGLWVADYLQAKLALRDPLE